MDSKDILEVELSSEFSDLLDFEGKQDNHGWLNMYGCHSLHMWK